MQQVHLQPCSCCYPIRRDEAFYNTSIIAMRGRWMFNTAEAELQHTTPEPGMLYKVELQAPVHIEVGQQIWLLYENPFVYHYGINEAEDIDGFRYCFIEVTAIAEVKENSVIIVCRLISLLSLQDVLLTMPEVEPLQEWPLGTSVNDTSITTYRMGVYYIIECSIQGDLGQYIIALEANGELYVVYTHDWCFSRSVVLGAKCRFGEEIKAHFLQKVNE